ncbi:MAG: 23S rRNA (pseudouridine(1915)-N(3))-methyltransferase RlmH [Arenicella sp.]
MRISLVAVGTKMPAWVSTAFDVYRKRMPKQCQLELVEIPARHRGKNADINRILRDEAEAIEAAIKPQTLIVSLDRKGRNIDTLELSRLQQEWIDLNQDVALIIGGPEGIAPQLIAKSNQVWSLSAMTFAHPLVRVMVAEQLYRGWSIIANLPYHRGGE